MKLYFCLFVILLYLLPQWLGIRKEGFQDKTDKTDDNHRYTYIRFLAHLQESHSRTLASSRLPPNNRIVHTFECPELQNFQMRIVREPISIYRADTVVQLPKLTPINTAANQLSQSPEHSLIDPTEDRLTGLDPLSQSLDSSQTDSEDNSLNISLPEIPMEIEPVQLMNQLLTQQSP